MKVFDPAAQRQRLGDGIERAIGRVLDHGAFIMGPEVDRLEDELASYCGSARAVTCSSGTDALLLVLLAKGARSGHAVFVPSFTFVATAETVALVGATPVFVDIGPDLTMDARSLEGAIAAAREAGLAPAGVVPADLFGQPADYDAIGCVAAAHDLWVMADAAQSFGASLRGRRVGTLAEATATSFFPTKPLGCYGDGGAIFTDDAELAEAVRATRVHGLDAAGRSVRVGINGRLDTIQAAVLIEKLKVFDEEVAARRRIARRYSEELRDVVDVPLLRDDVTSVWAQYTIQVPARDRVAALLRTAGVPSTVYYPAALHLHPAYRWCPGPPDELRVSEEVAARVLSLPLHPYLDDDDAERVIAAVRDAVRAGS